MLNNRASIEGWGSELAALILGIDPGSRHTGYGLLLDRDGELEHVAHGVISPPQNLGFAQRLLFLDQALAELLEKHRPSECGIERIFLGKSADSAFKLGHARGICLSQIARANCQVTEYAARSAKKIVTGSGAADKDQVRLVVMSVLKLRTTGAMDATDALSLAICHARMRAHHQRLKQLERQIL